MLIIRCEIGAFAKIAANSVVLKTVPPHRTAAGVPARIIGKSGSGSPAAGMDQGFVYGDGEAILAGAIFARRPVIN